MEEGSNAAKIATIALHTAPLILFATRFVDAPVQLPAWRYPPPCSGPLVSLFPAPGISRKLLSEKEKI